MKQGASYWKPSWGSEKCSQALEFRATSLSLSLHRIRPYWQRNEKRVRPEKSRSENLGRSCADREKEGWAGVSGEMAEGEVEDAAAAALRRLVGQIQELCDLYGSPPFFSLHHFQPMSDPRFHSFFLSFSHASTHSRSRKRFVAFFSITLLDLPSGVSFL